MTAVLAGGDPEAACGSFVTDAYLDTAYGGRGGCVGAQAPAAVARSLEVRSITVDGDRARAIVVPDGRRAATAQKIDRGPRRARAASGRSIRCGRTCPVGP